MMRRGDTSIVIFGRRSVLEALATEDVEVHAVAIAKDEPSALRQELAAACRARELDLETTSRETIGTRTQQPRHDQGVCAKVTLKLVSEVEQFTESLTGARAAQPTRVLALDNVTNPQNIGMVIRSARAAGISAMLWSLEGSPWIDGLVIKSSASTVLSMPIVRTPALVEGLLELQSAGFSLVGLDAHSDGSLFDYQAPHRLVMVIGSEMRGISPTVLDLLDDRVRIPMMPAVESLNVAAAATLVCFHMGSGFDSGT